MDGTFEPLPDGDWLRTGGRAAGKKLVMSCCDPEMVHNLDPSPHELWGVKRVRQVDPIRAPGKTLH